jgi:hypothetical protein
VSGLSKAPRGLPVAISSPDGSLEQVLAGALTVRNEIPDGSTWDGKSDLPMDEATFHQMLSEIEPGSNGSSPAPATTSGGAGSTAKAPADTSSAGSVRPTAKTGT